VRFTLLQGLLCSQGFSRFTVIIWSAECLF
jgi:hypothetical protein